jgi:hypothetical protein
MEDQIGEVQLVSPISDTLLGQLEMDMADPAGEQLTCKSKTGKQRVVLSHSPACRTRTPQLNEL